jgi:alkylation response protein AidB-like acyl-CoA dehydrogenase
MTVYAAPLDDIEFALRIAGLDEVSRIPGYEHADWDTVKDLMGEYGRFVADRLAPLNRIGDEVGSYLDPSVGHVVTPEGWKEAWRDYVEAGWTTVSVPAKDGGGGFPGLVGAALAEMLISSNFAFAMCPGLTRSAAATLAEWASDELRAKYLPKLVPGTWTGTMDLTEADAGSDLAQVRTMAVPDGDGTWRVTGNKIFISWGNHDMSENTVHLVLARTPDAPAGTRGISLFAVPDRLVGPDGEAGEPNGVVCVSTEHKLGIKGSPTCVLSYESSQGELVGELHRGLKAMFTMMNESRIGVGLQGLGLSERAYQKAKEYAGERKQGRLPGDDPSKTVLIGHHPDVRRMLTTMKAETEAMRLLLFYTARVCDMAADLPDGPDKEAASRMEAFLTPIAKAWPTDTANEVASLGIQVHGGMGFIEETGAAQFYRDARILPIYEGTNGIQALDLVFRKLRLDESEPMLQVVAGMKEVAGRLESAGRQAEAKELTEAADVWTSSARWLVERFMSQTLDVMAGATPFMAMSGLAVTGWLMGKQLLASDAAGGDKAAAARAVTASFFVTQVLPRIGGYVGAVSAGVDNLLTPEVLGVES